MSIFIAPMAKLFYGSSSPARKPDFTCSSSTFRSNIDEFKMSDFHLCSHVSIGLAGRKDETLYEGVVKDPNSNLKGMRVVLRQLSGIQAERRGKRALEVIPKLVSKQDIYNSYATQVHGYVPASEEHALTIVHGYYGCYSLQQQLMCANWLAVLEQRFALDEGAARRVGDDTTGGPTVTRHLRLIRIIMRDILIGVNYLHTQGLAHTELRLNNIHISAADRHVKVGIMGNAVAFTVADSPKDISKRMIAYDIRCVGHVMLRLVLRELMDPDIFSMFKNFLTKRHDPAGLREFLCTYLSSESTGLQVLDRDGGAGWNLLSCMLANDPADRISCTDALRHPFLCGPKWHVPLTLDMIRWSLGSAAVRIVEEYIYMNHQRTRLAQLVDLLERLNTTTKMKDWMMHLPGKWRLLYHTGRQIGLTARKASPTVLIGDVTTTFSLDNARKADGDDNRRLSMTLNIGFKAMSSFNWPHDKSGQEGSLQMTVSEIWARQGERLYETETEVIDQSPVIQRLQERNEVMTIGSRRRRKGVGHFLPKNAPKSLPILRMDIEDFDIRMNLDAGMSKDVTVIQQLIQEVRLQVPKEAFVLSKLACATYVDSRLLILRGISGDALLFVKSQ